MQVEGQDSRFGLLSASRISIFVACNNNADTLGSWNTFGKRHKRFPLMLMALMQVAQ